MLKAIKKFFARFRRTKPTGSDGDRMPVVYGAQAVRPDGIVRLVAEGDVDAVEGVWINGERWTRGYVDRQGVHQLTVEDAERLMMRMMVRPATDDDDKKANPPIEPGPMTVDKARKFAHEWRNGQLIRHEIDNDPILNATDVTFE